MVEACLMTLSSLPRGYYLIRKVPSEDDGMNEAVPIPLDIGTGVVVIVVAIAVVLVGLFATTSMRGREKRGAKRRDETRRDLIAANKRAQRDRNHRARAGSAANRSRSLSGLRWRRARHQVLGVASANGEGG